MSAHPPCNIDDQAVAHQLIVELLAHQFAFPVQWINTQDSLLDGPRPVSRLLELGPSATLTTMAQRSRRDMRRTLPPVQCLASAKDTADISYEYSNDVAPPKALHASKGESRSSVVPSAAPVDSNPAVPTPAPVQANPVPTPSLPAAVADVPLQPELIVKALVARKTKKPILGIASSKSIKELCGGKSTLQNELVGDALAEFTNVPDRPEDLPLQELCEAFGEEHTPGPVLSVLFAKLASSKMPSDFRLDSMRDYLSSRWRLGPMRQNAVLLYAVVSEPTSRLSSRKAAEEYVDVVVKQYADDAKIDLSSQPVEPSQAQSAQSAMDPRIAAEMLKTQKKLAGKQAKALNEFLGIDDSVAMNSLSHAQASTVEMQQALDLWSAEFSEDFLAGVTPRFDSLTTRRFNDWWSLARVEALKFACSTAVSPTSMSEIDRLWRQISGRTDATVLNIAAHALSCVTTTSPEHRRHVDTVLGLLESDVQYSPFARIELPAVAPSTHIEASGDIVYEEVSRSRSEGHCDYVRLVSQDTLNGRVAPGPFVSVRTMAGGVSTVNHALTQKLLSELSTALTDGISFSGKEVLITGAGPGSIGGQVIQLLLKGGARVIVTTSQPPAAVSSRFRSLYIENGSKGSELRLAHCNLASAQDCESLIDWIYSDLQRDIDCLIPFAAMSEVGTEIDELTAYNELAHRLMLVNVHRLMGRIIKNKRERVVEFHPTQVLLPLSPNHGIFGGDGLYSESKLGLESLMNRVDSESWADQLSITGVRMGWTRSTAVMNSNDIIAESMEQQGVLTFSAQEMALNISVLMTAIMVAMAEDQAIIADFSGGLDRLENPHQIMTEARRAIQLEAEIQRAIYAEEQQRDSDKAAGAPALPQTIPKLPRIQLDFPTLPDSRMSLPHCGQPADRHELQNHIAVVGFSELGPLGSARLRWEIEAARELSPAGYLEMAWLMGLVRYQNGIGKNGAHVVGWVDATSGEQVSADQIAARYGTQIASSTGIRRMEPGAIAGFDPEKKEFLEEVAIEEDLPEFQVPLATASAFRLQQGDLVQVRRLEDSDTCAVTIKRGACIMVPKAKSATSASVAGLLPSGWSPAKYGIPDELVEQLDPTALFAICCVAEAFFSAGIPDPAEIFRNIHLSELGNFLGTSMGGALKTRNLYRDAFLDKQVQNDVLADFYPNTTAAWVNMLLLGSTGPIRTPVGACATGVESIEGAIDSIQQGKTKMCLVGGVDDLQEDEAYGFSMLKATANADTELGHGRLPSEMSRPGAESRSGFVEAQGCGVQILCRADVAIEMGLPIYGLVAGAHMAADKLGRSVPAPGQGILTFARESKPTWGLSLRSSPRRLPSEESLSSTKSDSKSSTTSSLSMDSDFSHANDDDFKWLTPATEISEAESDREGEQSAFIKNISSELPPPSPSPLRRALAKYGLTIDDIDFASLHGTSTKAGDNNEAEVICKQMRHLGRRAGNPMWTICQKHLTGHPKAPAAAWMLNGCLQALQHGIIPPNRTMDNLDPAWRSFEHLVMPHEAVHKPDMKAFMLTSFGFGQKGGQLIGVAPRFLLAMLDQDCYDAYLQCNKRRCAKANQKFARAVMENRVVSIKDSPPYDPADADVMMLNPDARLSLDETTGSYYYRGYEQPQSVAPLPLAIRPTARTPAPTKSSKDVLSRAKTIGVDIVDLRHFTSHENKWFMERNYTDKELELISRSPDPLATCAGRWCAKEAVFKSLRTASHGAGAAMKDIEVLSDKNGIPTVMLRGEALKAARRSGIGGVQVSLSYEENAVVAMALGLSA